MSFWDAPGHLPSTNGNGLAVGEIIEGTLTHLSVEMSPRFQKLQLRWSIDHGMQHWANTSLWRAMAACRVDIGDRIRITRGPDMAPSGTMKPPHTYTVERLTPTADMPSAAVSGPATATVVRERQW